MATTIRAAVREAAAKASIHAAPKAFAFKGRNAALRTTALAGVASLAYAEGQTRAELVAQLRIVLGAKPSADEVKAAQLQYVVGRTAQRIASDASNKGKSVADLLAFALQLVTLYAAPVKDGTTPRKLRAGQLGRRTPAQHSAIRAAESAWSLVKAEVAPEQSNAVTLAEKNKRSTRKTPVRGADAKSAKAGTGLTHSELVKPDGKPHTKESATEYVRAMAATLLAFSNKHAGVMPTAHGAAVVAFKKAIEAADKEVANA